MIKVIFESEAYKPDNLASKEFAYSKLWDWYVENPCSNSTTYKQVCWDDLTKAEQLTYAEVKDALHIVKTEYADGRSDYWGMYDLKTLNNHLPFGVGIKEMHTPCGYHLEVREEQTMTEQIKGLEGIRLPVSRATLKSVKDGTAHYKTVDFGTLRFYNKDGDIHRDQDKPAVIWKDGDKLWYRNGELHREGGKPAVIRYSGSKQYWINGEQELTQSDLEYKLQEAEQDLTVALKAVQDKRDELGDFKKKQEADND